jgi:carboxyl-terminal processing protease
MPDYFVPIDTTYISDYYREIIGRGIFNIFVLDYVDNNRSVLTASYPGFDLFRDHYTVSEELMKQLIDYASHEGLQFDEKGYNVCRDQLNMLLKAYIARDLWNTSSFYEIVNRQNPAVIKAIEVLDSSTKYQAVLQNK